MISDHCLAALLQHFTEACPITDATGDLGRRAPDRWFFVDSTPRQISGGKEAAVTLLSLESISTP